MWTNKIADSRARTRARRRIFSHFLQTVCLLLNLFWTFPLKSIGFLRFQLIFRWFFNDFSGFSADFLDILQGLCGRLKQKHKKSWKSKVSPPPSNQGFLGPCPDDRAQNSVQDSLNESSVRPNPTLVFSKIRSQFWPPQYRPKPPQKIHPPEGVGGPPAGKKENPNWFYFY